MIKFNILLGSLCCLIVLVGSIVGSLIVDHFTSNETLRNIFAFVVGLPLGYVGMTLYLTLRENK